jgi:hypothetical protein
MDFRLPRFVAKSAGRRRGTGGGSVYGAVDYDAEGGGMAGHSNEKAVSLRCPPHGSAGFDFGSYRDDRRHPRAFPNKG